MVRLNITLPDDLVKDLQRIENKSQFIADTLRERFKKDKKQLMIKKLKEAYQQAVKEDRKVAEEWDVASSDGES